MYIHLQEIIVFSFGLFLFGCFMIFVIIFCVWKVEHRYVAYTVPSAVAFLVNLCILIIEIGFGVLWAPSNLTTMYVYTNPSSSGEGRRRRGSSGAGDDPVMAFGRIDTV